MAGLLKRSCNMIDNFNITSAQYMSADGNGENSCIKAVINGVEYLVPLDTDNIHYTAIFEWASQDGNVIADAD